MSRDRMFTDATNDYGDMEAREVIVGGVPMLRLRIGNVTEGVICDLDVSRCRALRDGLNAWLSRKES